VPLSSEYGAYKAVNARFWPWLSGTSLQNMGRFSLYARKRKARKGGALDYSRWDHIGDKTPDFENEAHRQPSEAERIVLF
jgi:hypothetical protein